MNIVAEQMNLSDLGLWSGRMSPERCPQTREKTSAVSSKKQQGSSKKMPLYLDLQKKDGIIQEQSWEMGGLLLGEYTMHSFGESPKEENVSRLSQILEDNPHAKYCLSEKACQGILNRANKRGKKLPPQLEQALLNQATPSKLGGGVERDSYGKRAGKGALVQTERSGTLGASQDQTLIEIGSKCLNPWDVQSKHIQPEDGIAETLYSGECRYGGGESYVLEKPTAYGLTTKGNGDAFLSEESHTSLTGGGGQAGQGYPCVTYGIEKNPSDMCNGDL